MIAIWTFLRSPFGLALVLLTVAAIGYATLRSNIRKDVENQIKVESQAEVIQHMTETADKLNKVTDAKENLRRTTRSQPDSLRENDGYRRD